MESKALRTLLNLRDQIDNAISELRSQEALPALLKPRPVGPAQFEWPYGQAVGRAIPDASLDTSEREATPPAVYHKLSHGGYPDVTPSIGLARRDYAPKNSGFPDINAAVAANEQARGITFPTTGPQEAGRNV